VRWQGLQWPDVLCLWQLVRSPKRVVLTVSPGQPGYNSPAPASAHDEPQQQQQQQHERPGHHQRGHPDNLGAYHYLGPRGPQRHGLHDG